MSSSFRFEFIIQCNFCAQWTRSLSRNRMCCHCLMWSAPVVKSLTLLGSRGHHRTTSSGSGTWGSGTWSNVRIFRQFSPRSPQKTGPIMENLLWTLRSRKSKLDILGPSGVFDIPEFCRTNRSTLDFFGTLLDAGIVENRLWNGIVEPIDRLWIFLGRCCKLELSKIDFGMVLWNQSIFFGFFWDAARRWNCLVEPIDQIDFGIYLWTLLDAGIVENRLWNCRVCQWPRLPREKSIGWSWSLLTAVCWLSKNAHVTAFVQTQKVHISRLTEILNTSSAWSQVCMSHGRANCQSWS